MSAEPRVSASSARFSRRALLRATGWSAVGLTALSSCRLLPVIPARPTPSIEEGLAWIQVTPEGRIRLRSPRQEMGQGAGLGLVQIAAEELGIAPEHIELTAPSTAQAPVARATVGSQSIVDFSTPIAVAAATLREALVTRAARALGASRAAIEILPDGRFTTRGGREVRLGALAGGEPSVLEPDSKAELRSQASGPKRWVGAEVPSPRLQALVTGAPCFASDVRRPGMLHGQAVPPPRFGARLARIDDTAARAVEGVVTVVVDLDASFVGVVGRSVAAVHAARAKLGLEWSGGSDVQPETLADQIDVDRHLAEDELEHALVDEDPEDEAPWQVDLRLEVPMAAHAPIEPRVAVADVREARADVWVGHQDPYYVRDVLADQLGWSKTRVVVHPQRIGGAFGGKTLCTVERDAVRLSDAVGRPVRVQWSRADELRAGFCRPPSSHRIRARLDEDGRVTDWWHAFVTGHVIFTSAALPGWLQTLTSVVPDKGSARGAVGPYRGRAGSMRRRVEMSDVRIDPPTGPWRGLGAAPNTLAIERAMDRLARAAGVDPVQFRLDHLDADQPRLTACLEAARPWWRAWGEQAGGAVGVAAGVYKAQTPVAAVARVVRDPVGALRVTHLGVVQDCGRVINPDQVRAQIEGNAVWGIGMILREALSVRAGAVEPGDFARYAIPRMGDLPRLEVKLVNPTDAAPTGAAESAIVAVPGAVLNAACACLGRDLTRLPVDPAALEEAAGGQG